MKKQCFFAPQVGSYAIYHIWGRKPQKPSGLDLKLPHSTFFTLLIWNSGRMPFGNSSRLYGPSSHERISGHVHIHPAFSETSWKLISSSQKPNQSCPNQLKCIDDSYFFANAQQPATQLTFFTLANTCLFLKSLFYSQFQKHCPVPDGSMAPSCLSAFKICSHTDHRCCISSTSSAKWALEASQNNIAPTIILPNENSPTLHKASNTTSTYLCTWRRHCTTFTKTRPSLSCALCSPWDHLTLNAFALTHKRLDTSIK